MILLEKTELFKVIPMTTQPFFSIRTATYNRAHTLPRVFKSLQEQTFQDFEWIIGDDGSTDNTADIVAQFHKESSF